ncbi:hypothetical protein B0H14DRAFT_2578179 [Mycena olivaceomarginata]|nr:hypothetical protein B0H14DRAFT_2578179 [Mycena olivaceomarginata]
MREAHEKEWSSESEYTLQAFSDYSLSESEERCAQIDEGIPELLTDDSGDEEEDEDTSSSNTWNKRKQRKAESIRKRQLSYQDGVFRVCDDWSDEEFIGDQELDAVAKEMATHIIEQGDTQEVKEFLFRTGERSSLSPRKETTKQECQDSI